MALGTIAYAELNSEIDTKPDEQNRKRHRDKIERTYQCQSDGRSNGQTGQQTGENRQDEAWGSQRKPQYGQHDHDCGSGIDESSFLERGVFLVGNGNRASEPQNRAITRRKIQI